ncbi:histidinol-phosphate aminotransferase [Klebsormidium nitens]|uniref:histidinol-phosphate transaminase n=1 Tax=Klebsormidium nitens TaxID=105231 RepID=A0A0U9HLT5_KLENI|nr:histidinol-phosphate aminotransferase [Klebsormidium nitens]|eukprot:GAQ81961.1 histidinol-phosphate aminotransferase [Klebsormidium nitens]
MAATAAVLRVPTSAVATSLQNTVRSSDVLQQTITPPFGSIVLSSRIQQLNTLTQSSSFVGDKPSENRMAGCARAVATTEGLSAAAEGRGDETDSNGALDGTQFLRPHLLSLAPYTPIEPFEILSARLGRRPEDIVKLDANENPYGPPPEVLEALGSMQFPNIYPDPESRRLREALAKDTGVGAEHLLVGCGADELIDLIMRCTLDPGDKIVDCPPTFTMYAFDADVNNAEVVTVSRKPDFSLDVPGIVDAVEKHNPKIVFLTSPNNPDGSVIREEDLVTILKLPVLVVLDEAYIEFSDEPSRAGWVRTHSNLIVLRTFSKRAGLAGLRVGFGAFPLSLVKYLWRAKQPYNVSVAAEVAACAALSNSAYLEDVKNALVKERERLFGLLQDVPFLKPYPSAANFILCDVKETHSAKEIKDALAKQGVMVRHYQKPQLKNFVRISVGKPEQTDLLMKALQSIP